LAITLDILVMGSQASQCLFKHGVLHEQQARENQREMLQYDGKDQANIRPLINLIPGQCRFATNAKY
jgi:hypothetical protein